MESVNRTGRAASPADSGVDIERDKASGDFNRASDSGSRARRSAGGAPLAGERLKARIKDSGNFGNNFEKGQPKRKLEDFRNAADFLQPSDDSSFNPEEHQVPILEKKDLRKLAKEMDWNPRRKSQVDQSFRTSMKSLSDSVSTPKRRLAFGAVATAGVSAGVYGLVRKLKGNGTTVRPGLSPAVREGQSSKKKTFRIVGGTLAGLAGVGALIFGVTRRSAPAADASAS